MKTRKVVINVELAVTTTVRMSREVMEEIARNLLSVLNDAGKKRAF